MKLTKQAVLFFSLCSMLSGCTGTESAKNAQSSPIKFSDQQIRAAATEDARTLGIVDGYYYGQESRNFKTAYQITSPETKADFAIVYKNFLDSNGQDMLKDWDSYVPYSKRAEFARQYWLKNSPAFSKLNQKMQIVWIHEALLDAGELKYRAIERLAGGAVDSPTVLAHDEEQKLVFQYAKDHHTFSSLSEQLR